MSSTIGALFLDRLWARPQGGRRDPIPFPIEVLGGGIIVIVRHGRCGGHVDVVDGGLEPPHMVIFAISDLDRPGAAAGAGAGNTRLTRPRFLADQRDCFRRLIANCAEPASAEELAEESTEEVSGGCVRQLPKARCRIQPRTRH